MTVAPVALFVYNRLEHTMKTIEALERNHMADNTRLIVFSDGPSNARISSEVEKVRNHLGTVRGFKSVEIIKRDTNYGLAHNIIDGVGEVLRSYGRIIVLEDDIITGPYFLTFINDALSSYEESTKVMHISGFCYPIRTHGLPPTFFTRLMSCWGWGTWADRWAHFEKNAASLLDTFSDDDIHAFTINGAEKDFWDQVRMNSEGKLDTWAVFWYASIFKNGGLCLMPSRTLTQNIGFDGSGTHRSIFPALSPQEPFQSKVPVRIREARENRVAIWRIQRFLASLRPRPSLGDRVKRRLRRVLHAS